MNTRHSIIGLVEVLNWMQTEGYDTGELLCDTGIDPKTLADPKATVSAKQELAFYQNLLDVSRDPRIILKAGFHLKISAYGIWGLALLSSPTFGKAIELGLTYIDFTYTYNKIELFQDGEWAGLYVKEFADLGSLKRHMIERDMSAIFVLFQTLLQVDDPFVEIRVSWAQRAGDDCYTKIFGCPVRFSCARTEVRFPSAYLDRELPQQNALTVQLCTEQLEQLRPTINLGNTMTEKVNSYLARTPLFRANIEGCAVEMNISARHLRRLLNEEKTSFQHLLDVFRYLLAQKYLSKTTMTLAAIAERLGYSDAANFSHAFKRWAGTSPGVFVSTQRNQPIKN